jgi:class 3 adenylate cyclase
MMATFLDAATAVRATLTAQDAAQIVEVDGYRPRMRAGIHTGRPQRIGGDWLGVDVNIAARVMDRATRGGLIISAETLERISPEDLESLGVTVKRVRRQVFAPRQQGVPADLVMYRIKPSPGVPGEQSVEDGADGDAED